MKNIFIIISFLVISCKTKKNSKENIKTSLKMNNIALIDKLFNELNNWDENELKCYENPKICSNYLVDGETNGWVSSHKEQLEKLNRIAVWNEKKMEYELFLLGKK